MYNYLFILRPNDGRRRTEGHSEGKKTNFTPLQNLSHELTSHI